MHALFLIDASTASGPTDTMRPNARDWLVPGYEYVPSWSWEGLDNWDSMVDRGLSMSVSDVQDATEFGAPADTPNSAYRTVELTLEAVPEGKVVHPDQFYTSVVLNVELAMGPEGRWLIKNITEL